MTLEDFPAYAREHWREIRQSLIDGSYQPHQVRQVVIPKPHGKGERKLGVPCVVDRVIQQAILQALTPIFDPEFSESSYGCRPQRSAHGAIRQVKTFVKSGYRIVVTWIQRPAQGWKQLKQYPLALGAVVLLGGVGLTKTQLLSAVHLALARDPLSRQLWLIVADEPTSLPTFRA